MKNILNKIKGFFSKEEGEKIEFVNLNKNLTEEILKKNDELIALLQEVANIDISEQRINLIEKAQAGYETATMWAVKAAKFQKD